MSKFLKVLLWVLCIIAVIVVVMAKMPLLNTIGLLLCIFLILVASEAKPSSSYRIK